MSQIFALRTVSSLVVAFVLAGCSSATSSVGRDVDAGDDAPQASSSSTSSGSTVATSGSSSSSSTAEDAGCAGDPNEFASLTSGPIACKEDSDCCVIVNECTNDAQIVSAKNETAAAAVWPTCSNLCTGCIPPAVNVYCASNGVCAGTVVPDVEAGANLYTNHCGGTSSPGTPSSTLHFGC